MNCRNRIVGGLLVVGLSVIAWCRTARADDHEVPRLIGQGRLLTQGQARPQTEHKAGYPYDAPLVSMESYNEHYSGGYVGGGKASHGHGRCPNEGTWGWDYTPFRPLSPRIFLGYSHGRSYQGGTGSYRTDGPKPMEHIKESVHGHFAGGE